MEVTIAKGELTELAKRAKSPSRPDGYDLSHVWRAFREADRPISIEFSRAIVTGWKEMGKPYEELPAHIRAKAEESPDGPGLVIAVPQGAADAP